MLSWDEARRLTDEVKADAQALWVKMELLYTAEAHKALGFKSWGAYCAVEFECSSSRAYELLDAGRVVRILGSGSPERPIPATEAVANELAILRDEPEAMAATWTEAIETHGEKPTAAQVREVVRGLASPEALDKDPRYLAVEDAVAILDKMPAANMILWPSEPYDVAQTDAAVLWMRRHWPAILDSWRQHKRELARVRKEAKATGLRAVA